MPHRIIRNYIGVGVGNRDSDIDPDSDSDPESLLSKLAKKPD